MYNTTNAIEELEFEVDDNIENSFKTFVILKISTDVFKNINNYCFWCFFYLSDIEILNYY